MKKLALLGVFTLVLVMLATMVNANPVLNSISPKTINEGSTLMFNLNGTGPDSGTSTVSTNFTFGSLGNQSNSGNETKATFTWAPTFTQAGIYNFNFTANDSDSSDTKSVTVTVVDTANPSSTDPALSAVSAQTVNEGNTLTLVLTSTAPDNSGQTTFTTNATFGTLTKNNNTQATFAFTPTFTQSGVYSVKFNASDGDSSSSQTTQITVVDVPAGVSIPSSVSIGSSSQKRSNPRADDKADREVNASADITITNSGSETLSNLSLSGVSTKLGFSSADLLVSAKFASTSLAVGASTTATITARVPEKLDAVDSNLVPAAFTVASLTFSANTQTGGAITASSDLKMQAENNLKIRDADVAFGSKTEDVDDGDTVDDMKPGDHVKVTIEAENKFSDKENVDIEDVELSVISDDLDVDEDEDFGSLGPKDKDTASVEFDIDKDADDDKHDAQIRVEGRDENGAKHGEKMTIQLEVKRKSHEIAIDDLRFSPASVSCEKEAELSVTLRNVGRNDEDDVTLRIESPDLKYGTVINEIEIDEDDDVTQKFTVPLKNLTAGNYRLTAEAYYEFDQFSNRDVEILTVQACEKEQPAAAPSEKEPKDSGVDVVPVTQPPVTAETVKEPEKGFFERPEYIALLVAANVVVLGGAIWLFSQLFAKP